MGNIKYSVTDHPRPEFPNRKAVRFTKEVKIHDDTIIHEGFVCGGNFAAHIPDFNMRKFDCPKAFVSTSEAKRFIKFVLEA